jgi:hypothetical protein
MNIDEFIERAQESAREHRYHADFFDINNPMRVACIKSAEDCEQLAEWLEKSKEYQQLEEQGRMIIFPCNKGDKIYEFYRECVECRLEAGETPEDIISMRRVRYFGYDGDEAYIYASQALPVRLFNNDEPFCIPVSEIGKTVFLSYEEAEAKLKELRHNND